MRVITIRKETILIVFYSLFILGGLAGTFFSETAPAFAMPVSKKIVLLDAGHGNWDPGKVSGKILEKDINLSIVQKLQAYLEEGGATVILTRADDTGLAKNKSGDMQQRKWIANASHADIFISIHQNSFQSAGVSGAQVFYFNESDNSKNLAACIQQKIKEFVDPSNRFSHKANSNYYVLKQTAMPAVIVECGFLTNDNERHKLTQEEYQEKMAWGIYLGIVNYFDEGAEPPH